MQSLAEVFGKILSALAINWQLHYYFSNKTAVGTLSVLEDFMVGHKQ